MATAFDSDAKMRSAQSLASPVPRDALIQFELTCRGLVDNPVAYLRWRGLAEAVQFGVGIPARRMQERSSARWP